MPVLNDNSFAQGAAAGQAAYQTFQAAQKFAVGLQRMKAQEEQFKAQLAMQERTMALKEKEFAARLGVQEQELKLSQFKLGEAEKMAKMRTEAAEAAPAVLTAFGDYVSALSRGEADAAATAQGTLYAQLGKAPSLIQPIGSLLGSSQVGAKELALFKAQFGGGTPAEMVKDAPEVAKSVEVVSTQAYQAASVAPVDFKNAEDQIAAERDNVRQKFQEAGVQIEWDSIGNGPMDMSGLQGLSSHDPNEVKRLEQLTELQNMWNHHVQAARHRRDVKVATKKAVDAVVSGIMYSGDTAKATKERLKAKTLFHAENKPGSGSATALSGRLGVLMQGLGDAFARDPGARKALEDLRFTTGADQKAAREAYDTVVSRLQGNLGMANSETDQWLADVATWAFLDTVSAGLPEAPAAAPPPKLPPGHGILPLN